MLQDSEAKIQMVAVVTQEKTVWPAVGVAADPGDVSCVVDRYDQKSAMVPTGNAS